MTMGTKNDIFKRYLAEYLKANKDRKSQILDSVSETTQMHRKASIRKFRVLQFKDPYKSNRRGRRQYYTPDVTYALKDVWDAASEICGELLHAMIPEYVEILQRDRMWNHGEVATGKLLAMSEATLKRRARKFVKARSLRGLSATRPSALKEIIPIFIGPWQDKPPGYGQLDTVVHCGASLAGDMAYTVNFTDVSTLWGKRQAQWNKGQEATKESLDAIQKKLPFTMLGAHPDTGSEFINWVLVAWAKENYVELTRSRPNHKNDNAYVEQKNGHIVRRFLGYTRLDCRRVIALMNEMYDVLDLYLNHFVSSKKCLEKTRMGSKYKKVYDKAQTPCQRVLAHPNVSEEVKEKLSKEHSTLNPLILKRKVDTLIQRVFDTQKRYGSRN